MEKKEIIQGIYYIGVDDTDLDLFEGQYSIPDGISYNSYVVVDEAIAIVDTVDARKTMEWMEKLDAVLENRAPDYLIVNHKEPDHSSNVKMMMDKYPSLKLVCTSAALKMVARFFNLTLDASRTYVVKDGASLSLGSHEFSFITAPMVHWPEVMMTYEKSTKTLFSADAFGKFGAVEKEDPNGWADEARRYYFNICGKYGQQVHNALKKLNGIELDRICSAHGPILDGDLTPYLHLYNTWSLYHPETKGIFIAYCSLHGNTEEAALKLSCLLKGEGNVDVCTSDLRRDDMSKAVENAFRYDRLVLAAPTYDNGIMPVMEDFLNHLRSKNYQKRKVAIIENGTWAPQAGAIMRSAMEELKGITIVDPVITVESTMKESTVEQLKEMADKLLA
jgi:flavorubredoxin